MSMTLYCEGTVTCGKSSRAARRPGAGAGMRPVRCHDAAAAGPLMTGLPAAHMMACAALLR